MPGGKREGAGRPRGSGRKGVRQTPAYKALAAMRKDFAYMIPDWAAAINLKGGAYPNHFVNLHVAFAEWIESQEPGKGDICRRIWNPNDWTRAFRAAFPHIKVKSNPKRRLAFLNYTVPTQTPPGTLRYGVCPCCAQACVIDDKTDMPVKTEVLVDVMEKLKAEAIQAVGEEQASRPTTTRFPNNGKTSSES